MMKETTIPKYTPSIMSDFVDKFSAQSRQRLSLRLSNKKYVWRNQCEVERNNIFLLINCFLENSRFNVKFKKNGVKNDTEQISSDKIAL